ncbi:hypothetical protein AB4212_04200 [Streptomyces sp. 2MCAF27]
MTTGPDDALKPASAALRIWQAANNPLVAVKHGRREDRAAVYDRFITLCINVFRPTTADQPEENRLTEDRLLFAEELYATHLAIQLRAPRDVREASSRLCSAIIGDPIDGGLFPFFIKFKMTAGDFEPTRTDEAMHGPNREAEEAEEAQRERFMEFREAKHKRMMDLTEARRWYKPRTWPAYRFEEDRRRKDAAALRLSNGYELNSDDAFRDAMAEFTEVARIDVHNRWRWWHWPMALFPPLRHWQRTR